FRLQVNQSASQPLLSLELMHALDREQFDFYTLRLCVADSAHRPVGLWLNVNVLDVNDNAPLFDHSDYSMLVNRTLIAGQRLLQVAASDFDQPNTPNSAVVYQLLRDYGSA